MAQKEAMIKCGTLSPGCTLIPEVVTATSLWKEHPCFGCNEDRKICKGLEKGKHRPLVEGSLINLEANGVP